MLRSHALSRPRAPSGHFAHTLRSLPPTHWPTRQALLGPSQRARTGLLPHALLSAPCGPSPSQARRAPLPRPAARAAPAPGCPNRYRGLGPQGGALRPAVLAPAPTSDRSPATTAARAQVPRLHSARAAGRRRRRPRDRGPRAAAAQSIRDMTLASPASRIMRDVTGAGLVRTGLRRDRLTARTDSDRRLGETIRKTTRIDDSDGRRAGLPRSANPRPQWQPGRGPSRVAGGGGGCLGFNRAPQGMRVGASGAAGCARAAIASEWDGGRIPAAGSGPR
jgi:hypothetical protein